MSAIPRKLRLAVVARAGGCCEYCLLHPKRRDLLQGGRPGKWRHGETLFRDDLALLVVDVPDTAKNRKWMKGFKARWKERLEQLEIWPWPPDAFRKRPAEARTILEG